MLIKKQREEKKKNSWAFLSAEGHADTGILIILVVMICFGLVMLFSASMTLALQMEKTNAWYYVGRQLIFSLLGFVAIWFLTRRDVRRFASKHTMLTLYAFITILLILVLIPGIGVNVNNQRRWLPFFFKMTFQPSEIAKLAVVFCSACYYPLLSRARRAGKIKASTPIKQVILDFWYDMGQPLVAVGIWCLLILRQSHFSAALILVCELIIVFIVAGIQRSSWQVFILISGAVILLLLLVFLIAGPAIIEAMQDSRRMAHIINRFQSFKGEINDTSYQPMQALIAIGSGGLSGVGLGMGVQKYNYLPEAHNDYVFAIICEELGFIGALLVLALFLIYFWRGLNIVERTTTRFGRIVASGFATLITMQALLSMAVNLYIIPATGVSLPFFSYGGTSNLFFMIGIGLLLNVSKFGTIPRTENNVATSTEETGVLHS
ncbi:MAG TPA: FtsW/RodA/SpoVE family cell cycle protein [Clostridiaceae bacterium]|nr:FtsW/RodA/SpoVE family cell cycle protein [Clostridiaceae bacterium]